MPSRLWGYLLDYWNSGLAVISVVGVAASALIPGADRYVEFFAFVALNAIVWMLVELRHHLRSDSGYAHPVMYESMRGARSAIVGALREQLVRSGRSHVFILGGRIRSIIEILREFADVVGSGGVPAKATGLTIELCCIDPDYLEDWPVPGTLPPAQRREIGTGFASSVRASVAELKMLSQRQALVRHGIHIEISFYAAIPAVYAYVFGDQLVIWGGYTWDREHSDVQGPSNPCYAIRNGQAEFESVRSWLVSHADLLRQAGADDAEEAS